MAKAKNYIYTSFAEDDALELEIDGTTYSVANFSMTFAVNEIPTASATLAVGRNALTDEAAKISETAPKLTSMLEAKVKFHAKGDWDSSGAKWPGQQVIFDGYFTGFSFKKMHGKIQVVANLIHWLADLGFSSCLNSQMHVANPGVMLGPAVMDVQLNAGGGTGAEKQTALVSRHLGYDLIAKNVESDWWKTVKSYLCALAGISGLSTSDATCDGTGDVKKNDRALKALSRIEGEDIAGECSLDYEYAKALPLETGGQRQVADAVASALNIGTMQSYFNQTFWDLLIKDFLPGFGAAIVPMVDRALVIADLPGWRGSGGTDGYWKTIEPGEYTATEQTSMLPKPLRGIGIYAAVESDTRVESQTGPYKAQLGGCYVSDAKEDSDGSMLYVSSPRWLLGVPSEGQYAGAMTGNKKQSPIKSATVVPSDQVELPEDDSPATTFTTVSELMTRYAHLLFVQNTLRGRKAVISGKLRFDIAPGSHVKLVGSPEQFLEVDALAADVYGMVQRVTVGIDAEARAAVTSYIILNNRNDAENEADRTSIDEHPLFGTAVIKGAPLLKELDLEDGNA